MFVLTHSKFFNALVFPYLVVILYVNDLQIFRFSYVATFLSVSLRICECKSNNLFLIDQMFFKEFLKFFDNLNSFVFHFVNLTPAPRFTGLQRYKSF